MHRGYEIIVFLSIPIIEECLLSCLEDNCSCQHSLSCEHTGSLEDIECIPEVSISEVSDEGEGVILLSNPLCLASLDISP